MCHMYDTEDNRTFHTTNNPVPQNRAREECPVANIPNIPILMAPVCGTGTCEPAYFDVHVRTCAQVNMPLRISESSLSLAPRGRGEEGRDGEGPNVCEHALEHNFSPSSQMTLMRNSKKKVFGELLMKVIQKSTPYATPYITHSQDTTLTSKVSLSRTHA
jgi:hypothetical protein